MIPQPSVFPVWAAQDQIDPISGQNNVLTPPTAQQQFGWVRQQFPPRNWFNWLGRYTNQWIQYLAQQQNQAVIADGTGTTPLFNFTTGGLCVLWVVDTGATSNFYNGMAYFPPLSASPVALNTINSSVLSVGTGIQTNGTVTISGGTGPYICWGQTKTLP